MKGKYKRAYMSMACDFAETSTAVRLKVGALIVNDDGIISEGCNGMPPHWPTEVCEDRVYGVDDEVWLDISKRHILTQAIGLPTKALRREDLYHLVTKPECRHAEIAALEKLWNKPNTARGASIFISHSPCKNCCIKLFTAGISKVYYRTLYRNTEGLDYLKTNGVEVEQI